MLSLSACSESLSLGVLPFDLTSQVKHQSLGVNPQGDSKERRASGCLVLLKDDVGALERYRGETAGFSRLEGDEKRRQRSCRCACTSF